MDLTPEQLAEYELRATMAERERCAKIAKARAAIWYRDGLMTKSNEAENIAAEILGLNG